MSASSTPLDRSDSAALAAAAASAGQDSNGEGGSVGVSTLTGSFAGSLDGGVGAHTLARRLVKVGRYCSKLPQQKSALLTQCEKIRQSAIIFSLPSFFESLVRKLSLFCQFFGVASRNSMCCSGISHRLDVQAL